MRGLPGQYLRLCLLTCLMLVGGGAQAFRLPDKAIPATGIIQVAFTPGDDAAGLIMQAIADAQKQVLVQAFSFTHKGIAQALVDAHRRGLDVQLVADKEQIARMERGLVPELAASGIPTFVDDNHDSAHNKVMVIDAGTPQAAVITGSFNFTHAAQHRNAENLLLIRGNEPLAAAYLRNWQRHRRHAYPYR